MKKTYLLNLLICFLVFSYTKAQVGINTAGPLEDGAIFQVESSDKGVLLPRIALTSRLDTTTITPGNVEGLFIYNTAIAGTGNFRVSPGFYSWDGTEWIRMYSEGFTVQFEQTDPERADDQTTTYDLPNLTQTIVAPYTGTYQVFIIGYYGTGLVNDASLGDAVSYCSISLEIDGTNVAETFISSISQRFRVDNVGTFNALAKQGNIVYNVDLNEGQSYTFSVRAREWNQINSDGPFGLIPGTYGFWGIPTDLFAGNSGGDPNAQKSSMTITLVRQF